MSETFKVTVLKQKVFHDGTSMVVLKPKGDNPEVAEQFIASFVADGVIEKPKGWKAPVIESIAIADGSGAITPSEPAADQPPA
jgi:hypothetical protein